MLAIVWIGSLHSNSRVERPVTQQLPIKADPSKSVDILLNEVDQLITNVLLPIQKDLIVRADVWRHPSTISYKRVYASPALPKQKLE